MNYIDRKAIGLERFFAQRSDTLTHLDEFTEEDLFQRLSLLSYPTRLNLAFIIRKALNDLRKFDGICCEELLPQDIFALAELSPFTLCKPEKMIIFLNRLRKINLRNEQQRISWLSALKTAASRFDASTASFINAFFTLSNQRVFIKANDGNLTLSLAEREWGRVSAVFENCSIAASPAMPLPGYAIACEAEVDTAGAVHFILLIDTYFGENHFEERLLSDNGWQQLSFTCSDMKLDAQCVDYAENMRRCGIPKADFIDSVCRILINKRLIMGDGGLNSLERSMLPTISLLGGLNITNGGDLTQWQGEELIQDALSNRYAIENFSRLLKEAGCDDLQMLIDTSARHAADGFDEKALRCAKLFYSLLERKIADGSARPLLHRLYSLFCDMSRLNDGSTARTDAARAASECLRCSVQPFMDDLGFHGDFPHFRRDADGQAEYISFILDPNSDRLYRGVMSYTASIAAAEPYSGIIDNCKKFGIDPGETTALDCLAEALTISRYGEMRPLDSELSPQIDINLYGDKDGITGDTTALLEDQLVCIEQQFANGHISAANRRYPERLGAAGAFFRAFVHCLPITVVLAIIALGGYLLCGGETAFGLGNYHMLLFVFGCGFILNSILSALRCLFCSFRIWRY